MHQKLLLDKITSVLAVTDQANTAKLLKLVDEAGRIFVGGAGRSGLVSRFLQCVLYTVAIKSIWWVKLSRQQLKQAIYS
jgi:D-arabinose 5-phosphate isomerase GutQ